MEHRETRVEKSSQLVATQGRSTGQRRSHETPTPPPTPTEHVERSPLSADIPVFNSEDMLSFPSCFKVPVSSNKKMDFEGEMKVRDFGKHREHSMSLPTELSASSVPTDNYEDIIRSQSFSELQVHVKNETLMEEIKQLKHLLAASPDEKLQEIHRLREELKNLKHSCHHCEEENQSLSLETEMLRQQLRATAEQCRALVIQLERKGATGDSKKQKENVVEKERQRYESEIAKLRNQLTEVIQANTKWQVYNSQRDAFVVTLQRQISNLKCQVDRSKHSPVGELNEDTQKEIDKILISTKEKVNAIQEEKEALEDELRKFKLLCNQKEKRIAELEEQVRHLSSNASRAEDDVTEMLKHQIRLCTEDFEAERRDRELAQSKISDLETQLELLKRQLDMYENSAASAMANQREAALINYKQKYYDNQTPYGLRSRGPSGEVCWGRTVPDTADLEEDCDAIDGPAATGSVSQKLDENLKQHELNQSEDPGISHGCDIGGVADERLDSEAELQLAIERSKQDVGGFGLRTKMSEGLRCPTCDKYFDAASHLELLDHMDECSS